VNHDTVELGEELVALARSIRVTGINLNTSFRLRRHTSLTPQLWTQFGLRLWHVQMIYPDVASSAGVLSVRHDRWGPRLCELQAETYCGHQVAA
jgi:hypothetical protein